MKFKGFFFQKKDFFISGINHNPTANVANISILRPTNTIISSNMPNHPMQLQHQQQQQQQSQINLFQPQNLSPHLNKTENKINANINNPSSQHVMINFNENNGVQMMRAQQQQQQYTNNDAAENSSTNNNGSFNKQTIKNDEISDHIDSVINDVVNGHGSIPSNINDFEEETSSSFKDAMFNNEDHFFNESESMSINSNFGTQTNQQQPTKNTKKKNANKNVSLKKHYAHECY